MARLAGLPIKMQVFSKCSPFQGMIDSEGPHGLISVILKRKMIRKMAPTGNEKAFTVTGKRYCRLFEKMQFGKTGILCRPVQEKGDGAHRVV